MRISNAYVPSLRAGAGRDVPSLRAVRPGRAAAHLRVRPGRAARGRAWSWLLRDAGLTRPEGAPGLAAPQAPCPHSCACVCSPTPGPASAGPRCRCARRGPAGLTPARSAGGAACLAQDGDSPEAPRDQGAHAARAPHQVGGVRHRRAAGVRAASPSRGRCRQLSMAVLRRPRLPPWHARPLTPSSRCTWQH